MAGCVFYIDSKLEEKVRERKIIPYRTFPNQKYIKYHWYFLSYDSMLFKVLDVIYGENKLLENIYAITDDNMQQVLCTELGAYDYTFKADSANIANEDIINNDKTYTGAEIIYWFFINNKSGKKYEVFWKYLDWSSRFRLKDKTQYKVYGETDSKKRYISGRIEAVKKAQKTYQANKKDDEYMSYLVERDKRRMKNKHRKDMWT